MGKEKLLSTIAIIYFMLGFVFAVSFALYYRWSAYSFLSPGFYSVIFTWPFQLIGFASDFLNYGLAGKPI
ncbi:hypothetical protein HY383_03580 [Candidatus Daviesbacteria bacterium]|nr:hypothetical protein [Candidatus Daviesbacteria bacterium]